MPFFKKKLPPITVPSPLTGSIVALETLSDRAFAEKMMGEGVAVLPEEGVLRSPVDGTVDTIAETSHALGLHADSGFDLLIHVGLETVNLKGKHFYACVAEGARVRVGDILLRFDLDAIRAAGYQTVTPITVVDGEKFQSVRGTGAAAVEAGAPLLVLQRKGS